MSAYIRQTDTKNKSGQMLDRFAKLEAFLLSILSDEGINVSLKELNEYAINENIRSTVKDIRTLLYYWTIKGYIQKRENSSERKIDIVPSQPAAALKDKLNCRIDICHYIVKEPFSMANIKESETRETVPVEFSLIGLWKGYKAQAQLTLLQRDVQPADMADALLYLSKTGADAYGYILSCCRYRVKEPLNKSGRTSWRHIFRLTSSKNLEIHKVFLRFFAFVR